MNFVNYFQIPIQSNFILRSTPYLDTPCLKVMKGLALITSSIKFGSGLFYFMTR
jgi:hypothetical protein